MSSKKNNNSFKNEYFPSISPLSSEKSPIFSLNLLLTAHKKYYKNKNKNRIILFIIFIILITFGLVIFLHWKNIINIPFLPASTKQHPEK